MCPDVDNLVVAFLIGDKAHAIFTADALNLLITLTNEFFLELAAFKPGIAFFRDDAFNDAAARINVEQIFKQNSPNTTVEVI